VSIVKITGDNIVNFTTVANPKRVFASSSSGVTGSISLNPDYSTSIKNSEVLVKFNQGHIDATNPDAPTPGEHTLAQEISSIIDSRNQSGNTSINFNNFFKLIQKSKHAIKQTKKQEVRRFIPGTRLSESLDGKSNFFAKSAVKNCLMYSSRVSNPTANWAFTNYNTLNFFTSNKTVPKSSVLIYPSAKSSTGKNPLGPDKSFTFDFYIKPKADKIPFNAGTILHMSSCYAVSLVSGSQVGHDGKPAFFRIMLQLSQSANIRPSKCVISGETVTTPQAHDGGFVFVSKDNSLKKNSWHHVSIRWSGKNHYNGNGDIMIDGTSNKSFNIISSSVMQATSSAAGTNLDPNALFVGNFYEGTNIGTTAISKFFAPDIATSEGLTNINSLDANGDPTQFKFRHPLNAEVHDLKIYNYYRADSQINSSMLSGSSLDTGLLFYVPPFFVKESRRRSILTTPFREKTGQTDSPFNTALSFGVGGLEINLENYTRDFVNKEYPRLFNLSSSVISTNVSGQNTSCNFILYSSQSLRKRNLTILPNDNGLFYPNFNLLASGALETSPSKTSNESRFVNDKGERDLSLVSLNQLVTSSVAINANPVGESIVSHLGLVNASPENLNISPPLPGSYNNPSEILTIYKRTGDSSSNEIAFFDVSNLMYGDRILPETLKITDLKVTGSGGYESFTLRDDGHGNIYRADCNTKRAVWSSVGNIFYEHGIIVIKSPNLPLFGKDSYEVEFLGEKKIYTLEVQVPVSSGLINSSSNPTFKKLVPSDYYSEVASEFVYISGINLHDNNLNVLMKTNLAQPLIKRDGDRVLVKIRMDF
jgi:hypothetical protein